MQAKVQQRLSVHERMVALGRSHAAISALAIGMLVAWCALLFWYLLAHYPYDGLYGQDSYAYYYQARAILQDMTGQASQPWQLFSGAQLYHWPVGYHLLIIGGQIITGSVAGGRETTLFLAGGAVIMLYLLVGEMWAGAAFRARVLAGLVAGGLLPLVATFTRMGLSVMADVPALFCGLLGIYCSLRAWPVQVRRNSSAKRGVAWAVAGGVALGLAVLMRYGAIFFVVPVVVYYLVRRFSPTDHRQSRLVAGYPTPWWALAGFAAGILPQLFYLIAYKELNLAGGAGASTAYWLNNWSPANLFSRTVTGPDGTSTFGQPMIVFYLLAPFFDSDSGFLSGFYLPALFLGAVVLVRARIWPVIALLVTWWLPPVLFFAGAPYQAQRFALTYLPTFLVLIGIGATKGIDLAIDAVRRGDRGRRALAAATALVVMACVGAGIYREQGSVRGWMGIHESFKVEERAVVALARQAAGSYAEETPPRVVAFGMTSVLYHYTQWPTIELFNSDQNIVAHFLDAPGTHLLVIPEADMSGQWANTPLAARWLWLQQNYSLTPQGTAGAYSVYSIDTRR